MEEPQHHGQHGQRKRNRRLNRMETNQLQIEIERILVQKNEFIASREETLLRLRSMKTCIDERNRENRNTSIATSAVGVTSALVGLAFPVVGIPLAVAAGSYKFYSNYQNKSFEEEKIKEINDVLENDRQISERLKKSSEDIMSHVAAGASATATAVACAATVTASTTLQQVRQLHLLGREVLKYSNSVSAMATRTIMHSFVVLSVTIDLYQLYSTCSSDAGSELAMNLQQVIVAMENHRDEQILNLDILVEECQHQLTEATTMAPRSRAHACCILV